MSFHSVIHPLLHIQIFYWCACLVWFSLSTMMGPCHYTKILTLTIMLKQINLILYLPSAAAIFICLHLFGGISRSQAPILCEHLVLMFKMCTIYCDLSWNSCDIFKDSLHPVEIGTGNSLGYRPQCGAIMRLVAPLFWLASSLFNPLFSDPKFT